MADSLDDYDFSGLEDPDENEEYDFNSFKIAEVPDEVKALFGDNEENEVELDDFLIKPQENEQVKENRAIENKPDDIELEDISDEELLGSDEEMSEDDLKIDIQALEFLKRFSKPLKILTLLIILLLVVSFIKARIMSTDSKQIKEKETTSVEDRPQEQTETYEENVTSIKDKLTENKVSEDFKVTREEHIDFKEDLYSSYMILHKRLQIFKDGIIPIVYGSTADEIEISFPITMTQYNEYENGKIYDIYYNKVDVNGQTYLINVEVGDVVKR